MSVLEGTLYDIPFRVGPDQSVGVDDERIRPMLSDALAAPFRPSEGFYPHSLVDRLRAAHGDALRVTSIPPRPEIDPDVVY